ncbi:MAG: hypothetical protein ACK4SY_07700, partial [Pyrobaculum sp.]
MSEFKCKAVFEKYGPHKSEHARLYGDNYELLEQLLRLVEIKDKLYGTDSCDWLDKRLQEATYRFHDVDGTPIYNFYSGARTAALVVELLRDIRAKLKDPSVVNDYFRSFINTSLMRTINPLNQEYIDELLGEAVGRNQFIPKVWADSLKKLIPNLEAALNQQVDDGEGKRDTWSKGVVGFNVGLGVATLEDGTRIPVRACGGYTVTVYSSRYSLYGCELSDGRYVFSTH